MSWTALSLGFGYLEFTLASLEKEGGCGVDDEPMNPPCARTTFDGQIGVQARVKCPSGSEHSLSILSGKLTVRCSDKERLRLGQGDQLHQCRRS